MLRLLLAAAVALALACGGTQAAKLDLDAVNQAQFSEGEPSRRMPAGRAPIHVMLTRVTLNSSDFAKTSFARGGWSLIR